VQRLAVSITFAAALVTGTACTDFATPAELAKTTILAVVADPPLTPPGQESRLEPIIVDGSGRVTAIAATWQLVETVPGVAPMGRVTAHDDGTATYTAPAKAPPIAEGAPPPIDSIQLRLAAEPRPLTAIKGVAVVDLPSANPTVKTLTADGADAMAGVTVAAGAKLPLAVSIEPAAGDDATYAWYTTRGEIETYQSPEGLLTAPAEAGTGWIFVVVRDGRGGVAWRGVPLTVQ
jgi:hypothetical protein